jgi:hypothetical protein
VLHVLWLISNVKNINMRPYIIAILSTISRLKIFANLGGQDNAIKFSHAN